MITSTPVSFSSARMLRPSRPMIRPFISSLGSSTRRVVLTRSACVAASRCIATERMLRARRSASARVSSSICCRRSAGLVARLLLDLGEQQLLRLRGAQPREPLELAALDALRAASAPRAAGRGCARGPRAPACGARGRRAGSRATPPRAARAPPSARSPRAGRAALRRCRRRCWPPGRRSWSVRGRRSARAARGAKRAYRPSPSSPRPSGGAVRYLAWRQPRPTDRRDHRPQARPRMLLIIAARIARPGGASGRSVVVPLMCWMVKSIVVEERFSAASLAWSEAATAAASIVNPDR